MTQENMILNSSATNYTSMEFFAQNFSHFSVARSLFLGIILVFFMSFWSKSRINLFWEPTPKKFPPGPRSHLAALIKYRHMIFHNNFDLQWKILDSEYGKVVGCFLSLARSVLVSDLQVLKTAFNNPAILGRPPQKFLQLFDDNLIRGIVNTSGDTWKEIRRFTVTQLKSLGMGRSTLEPAISQQVEECIAILRTKTEQPFSTKHFFDILAFNVLWEIISSQKLPFGDPQAEKLMNCAEKITSSMVHYIAFSRHPKLGAWVLSLLGIKNPFPEINQQFRQFTSEFLNSRLNKSSTSNEQYADFTEAFLQKIQSTKDINSPFYGQRGYENLQELIRDLFVGGTDTTGSTLSWVLLFLAIHPEKQEKLQMEIDRVLENRAPTLDDRPMMKYTEAVINETLRKSSVLPFALPHAAIEDTTIENFHVPKDTVVVSNICAIHHCEKTWGDPHSFRPGRFLTEDETSLIKYEEFIPFGIGRRMCPGMALAYSELFMFITRIFQEFTITWNPHERKPTMERQLKWVAPPLNHTLIIKPRTKNYSSSSDTVEKSK